MGKMFEWFQHLLAHGKRLPQDLWKLLHLALQDLCDFGRTLLHKYPLRQFHPEHVKQNFRVISQLSRKEELSATYHGRLYIHSSRFTRWVGILVNLITFGARRAHMLHVCRYTLLAISLEFNNPFSEEILTEFLQRKIGLLERAVARLERILGGNWTFSKENIKIYERNSLLQHRIVRQTKKAVLRSGSIPLIEDAQAAILKGYYPLLVVKGCSGAYWMRGTDRRIVGLFKPFDEEILAPNNPSGPELQGALGQRRMRPGIRVGESAHHEVATYLVDEHFGFGLVPRTHYARFTHSSFFSAGEDTAAPRRAAKEKWGSFQEYVEGYESLTYENMGEVPLTDFQLMVLLDVIVGNSDRNMGNFLLGDETLAAIDHGVCFPDYVDDLACLYWGFMPQGKECLHPNFVEFLRTIDLEALERKLHKRCFIPWEALARMRERIALFLAAVEQDVPPGKLVDLMDREHLLQLENLDRTLAQQAASIAQEYLSRNLE